MVPVALPTSLTQTAIAPADSGDVWVTGSWNNAARTHGDSNNVSLVPADAYKPYRDPTGVTWLVGHSLTQWKGGEFRKVALSPDGVSGSFMWQVASDKFGTLWAFCNGLGFFTLDHYRWKAWATPPDVAKQHVTNMFSDSTGLIWVSTEEGDIITLDKGNVLDYPVKPDSPLRNVKAFAEHAPGQIWVGGTGGLALIDHGRFRVIKPAAVNSLEVVAGVVDAGSNGLWLSTADGVVHVSRDETERALRDSTYRVQAERFDSSDGLPGRIQAVDPFLKVVEGTDGRIWFAATRGVAWIDPNNIPRNAVPPPVYIEGITANGKPYDASHGLWLPPHIRDLTIDYAALSFVAPEKIHFRYRLEGQDPDWREVVNDRQVQYSNLAPRQYIFRLMACNDSGVWNEVGTSLEFSIAPAYYQTLWFRLFCVFAFAALLWALYHLRLQKVQQQFAIGLEARVDERTRIARDLHDTLLQSFNALLLRLQTVSNVLPSQPDEAKQRIDRAIEQASSAITEGRDTLNELRSSGSAAVDLDQALSNFAKELLSAATSEPVPEIHVQVEGTPVPLNPIVRDEVYRIATEAVRNAIRHANARRIEVEIRYDEQQLRLRIGDDGTGIGPAILNQDHLPGHWGLRGMRERAKLVGATLEVWSQLSVGTEIDLSIPAEGVYTKASSVRMPTLPRFRRS